MNLIYPEETEEIGKSIIVLHTENRRLVSLIQRLTKDSEEHAKNWYYDYNVRNQYLNNSNSNQNAPSQPHHHPHHHHHPQHHQTSAKPALQFPPTGYSNSHLEPSNMASQSINSACNHLSYHALSLALTPNMSATNPSAPEDENSLMHRYNGQQSRSGRLFADETEEIFVETDISSCDSPVRQIFCQSGSSLDEQEGEERTLLSNDRSRPPEAAAATSPTSEKTELVKDETRV